MDYKRFIKLLLPSNQFIKVQISKDENKVREVLSKITNISPSQIKGIKDLKGNYYTLSSFIKNNNYNSDSDTYPAEYLVFLTGRLIFLSSKPLHISKPLVFI